MPRLRRLLATHRVEWFAQAKPAVPAVVVGALSAVWIIVLPAAGLANEAGARMLSQPPVLVAALVAIVGLTLVACLRQRYPVTSYLLTITGTAALMLLLGDRSLGATPLYWFAIAALAIRVSGTRLVVMTALGILTDLTVTAMLLVHAPSSGGSLAQLQIGTLGDLMIEPALNIVLSYGIIVAFGRFISRQRHQVLENKAAIDAMHRERENKIRKAITTERQNMARELHDVAAHHLTGMLIQSKGVQKLFISNPEQAQVMLAGSIDHGQRSLNSLRQIVGILRVGEEMEPSYPQPMIADIDELIQGCRSFTDSLVLERDGAFEDIDSAVQLSCYRIVQESLSNAIRHAPGTRAKVTVRRESDSLRIEVINSPHVSKAGAKERHLSVDADTGGQRLGIVGMRERATILGGDLVAGLRDDGGWGVLAVVPLNGDVTFSGFPETAL